MVLTKNVNGIVQEMSAKEEAEIKASWARGQEKQRLKTEALKAKNDAKEKALDKLFSSLGNEEKTLLKEAFSSK